MRRSLVLTAIVLAGPAAIAQTKVPASGEAVLQAMHDRYAGKWYHTLTFVQETAHPGRPAEAWYESAVIPGKLRIDRAPIDSGNMSMYVGDSVYSFRAGKRTRAGRDRNLLMTLGFDVYGQPATLTARQLQDEGVDLSKVRADTLGGKHVWVVGAAAGDTSANQFWVEQDRLLFVRLIQRLPGRNGETALLDVAFADYRALGGGWIAVYVPIKINGQIVQEERYSDPRADSVLDPALFDVTTYTRPGWVK